MDVFQDSIAEAEGRLRKGDTGQETKQLVANLQNMESKIRDLSLKLKTSGLYETADKASAVLRRLNGFLDSYERGTQGNSSNSNSFGFEEPGGSDFWGSQPKPAQTTSFDGFNNSGPTSGGQTKPSSQSGGNDFWNSFGGSSGGTTKPAPKDDGYDFFAEPTAKREVGNEGGFKLRTESGGGKNTRPDHDLDLLGITDLGPSKPLEMVNKPQGNQGATNMPQVFDLTGGKSTQQPQLNTNPFLTQGGPQLGNLNQMGAPGMTGMGSFNVLNRNPSPQELQMMQMQQLKLLQQMNMGYQNTNPFQPGFTNNPLPPAPTNYGKNNLVSFAPNPPNTQQKSSNDPFSDLIGDI